MRYLRVTIPLPVADNAGAPFPAEDVMWFETGLLRIGSGFRKHLRVWGGWDDDGTVCEEPVAVYEVTIEVKRLDEVEALLEKAGAVFRQKAILLEVSRVEKVLLRNFNGHEGRGLVAAGPEKVLAR
jgi:hypothetical protein